MNQEDPRIYQVGQSFEGKLTELVEQRAAEAAPEAAGNFTPTLPGTVLDKKEKAKKQRNFSRAERREMKRGGGALIGNNRPNNAGRAIRQEAKMMMVTVGEDKKLVEVATIVRGKGGKKKVVLRKTLLSREIIATGQTDLKRMLGTVAEGEDESIKTGEIKVAVVRNGRLRPTV